MDSLGCLLARLVEADDRRSKEAVAAVGHGKQAPWLAGRVCGTKRIIRQNF